MLGMANSGKKNTNTSQFYITLDDCVWCDKNHVVFGRAIDGKDIIKQIGETYGSYNGEPGKRVDISDCGIVSKEKMIEL